MKLSRDGWLGLGLAVLLIVVMIAAGLQKNNADTVPYISTSAGKNGVLALKLWLEELDYQVVDTPMPTFAPPADADILLMLYPVVDVSETELKTLDKWVENGGTLIVAGDNMKTLNVFFHYDFQWQYLYESTPPLAAHTPLLVSPPQVDSAPLQAGFTLSSNRKDFITLLANKGQPVVVLFKQGQGRVILSTSAYPFSNLGIKETGNAQLVLNLISLGGSHKKVWFDEWHHGFQSSSIVGPGQWMRRTSLGHALLFILGAVFLALVLQGRGFGRPIPLQHEIKRRGPLEHVTAVANLNRKAGHRASVLAHYHQQLKRHLGKRYRLDPALPDAEYVHTLVSYNSAIDPQELLNLLTRLSQKNVSDGELVKLADEAAKWMTDR